ncbi:hypothetical protein KI387_015093, partial [Taxus chinensis]
MNNMPTTRLGFCLFLGLLGLISLSTAIVAEFKHTKADEVRYEHGECTLPSSPALWLGSVAAIALVVAQLLANAMGGCVCCCTKYVHKIPSRNRSIAILCLFFSWVTFGCALFLLVAGASMNERQPYKKQWMERECFVVKKGIFASAGLLSLLTVIFSTVFYLAITTKKVQDETVTGGPHQHIALAVDGTKDPSSKVQAV